MARFRSYASISTVGGSTCRRSARRSKPRGADISSRFGHVVLNLARTMHPREARRQSAQMGETPGVIEASISPAGVVRVEFDRDVIDDAAHRATA
jgi:hypothetical protein